MFEWKECYSCNISKIDNQHKRLFELADEIYTIVSVNDGYDHFDEIMEAIKTLKEYTVYHFSYEEEIMRKYEYGDLDNHKIEHEAFINKISSINEEEIDEKQKNFLMDLLEFIVNWIENHILKSDLKYKEYLNGLGVY
ncbi:bacteriohemerythrin [Clostridium botulinum]|uniref:Hemerythrin-like metal-binding domain protein n=2 Tax=Clostridium botulinum TaxID=1491 RepID=C1FSJ6_CLOBJ|nr:bacteriohemerythrin [Clostridium botulinum]ACO86279.1 hemerythrin-like metal-binding domain protein [Clostridium botulinum A2 str. Kyoto]AUN05710.1 bacteriohemerythrin [Clostridium botulinum]MBN3366284.1 bacteriohemerythrin [Clostridium botulinum]MBN3370260.1 bacteriohemerythrin [Clostridium botulinum]MBN3374502.1 bacteriohemerythrin [Clostridium botulinum]